MKNKQTKQPRVFTKKQTDHKQSNQTPNPLTTQANVLVRGVAEDTATRQKVMIVEVSVGGVQNRVRLVFT
jgi:hypothetical protein